MAMMIGDVAAILAYCAAAVVAVWGVAHAVPTGRVLAGLGTLTALTGARTPVVWFKICPVLLAGSAALLVAASVL